MNNNNNNCFCFLLSRPPSQLAHGGQPCGWGDLAGACPDCGKVREACSFFSENAQETPCANLTRLVELCLLCTLDDAKRRAGPAMRARVEKLSSGGDEQLRFINKQADVYKDSIGCKGGVWLPDEVESPDSPLFWNRTVVPWTISRTATPGSVPTSMRQMLTELGIGRHSTNNVSAAGGANVTSAANVASASAGAAPPGDDIAALRRDLNALVASLGAGPGSIAQAQQQVRQALNDAADVRVNQSSSSNPSAVFNFGNSVAAAAPTTTREPMDHTYAWQQCFEGTSPLSVFVAMQSESRHGVTPKQLRVETVDAAGAKKRHNVIAWPAAKPEAVPAHKVREIGDAWRQKLVTSNRWAILVTPEVDQPGVPQVPVDVELFLAHCYSCLDTFPHTTVLRAWEATHHHVVDVVLTRRAIPAWATAWLLPAFQTALAPTGPGPSRPVIGGVPDAAKCCRNWNFKSGHKCATEPAADCQLQHVCLRCGGPHPILACTRRE